MVYHSQWKLSFLRIHEIQSVQLSSSAHWIQGSYSAVSSVTDNDICLGSAGQIKRPWTWTSFSCTLCLVNRVEFSAVTVITSLLANQRYSICISHDNKNNKRFCHQSFPIKVYTTYINTNVLNVMFSWLHSCKAYANRHLVFVWLCVWNVCVEALKREVKRGRLIT